jgi:hypothetical protein
MPKFLKHKEFLPFAPEHTGKVRVNHISPDCGGESNSMIVERKDDGSIFGYCHRCSKSGHYDSPFSKGSKRKSGDGRVKVHSAGYNYRVKCYDKAATQPLDWPEDVRGRLRAYGLSDRELTDNDIRYSAEMDGLYLTVFNHLGPIGYTLRRFNWDGPKYLFDVSNSDGPAVHVPPATELRGTVVLTEDILSAIKVSRHANAVACLGTSPSIEVLSWLIKTYSNFVIFFDDDNKIVKKQQRVLRNTLSNMGTCSIITGVGKDPKSCSNAELAEFLGTKTGDE